MSHVECPNCEGEGFWRIPGSLPSAEGYDLVPCAECDESGAIVCPECGGDGFISLAPFHYDSCGRCKGEP